MSVRKQLLFISSLVLFGISPGWSQAPAKPTPQQTPQEVAPLGDAQTASARPDYVLAPTDQVLIRVPEAEEIHERPFRIDSEGNVTLPLVGVVKAGGLSVEQFEAEVGRKLRVFIRAPQVSVSVVQFRSSSILLSGSFAKPGIYPLQRSRTLLEMLSSVGGLQPNASRRIRLTRRSDQGEIPLPNAVKDTTGGVSTIEISLNRLMEAANPAENIALLPYDVLYAGKAEMVYLNVEGANKGSGAYPLEDREYLSVVQLISMAGGLDSMANPEKARLLRPVLNTSRRAEIPINVKAILAGQQSDYPLMPNDLLVVPRSKSVLKAATWIIPTLVTSLIFVAFR